MHQATPELQTQPAPAEPAVIRAPLDVRSASLSVLAVLAGILMLQWAQEVFVPIVLGVLISYALDPIVAWLRRLGVPRLLGATLVVGASVTLLCGGGYMLRDQAWQVIDNLPTTAQKVRAAMRANSRNGSTAIERMQEAATEFERAAVEATAPTPQRGVARVQVQPIRLGDYLWWGSMSLVAFITQALTIVFFVFFLLVAGDLYKQKLTNLAGSTFTRRKITAQILDEINRQIARFLLVRLALSVIVGLATWAALVWLGLEQAALWAVLAGVFNSIPYFGPIIVSAALAVVAFVQFGTISMTLWVSGVALAITSLEGWLLDPPLLGRAARLNEVAVFVGLLFWGWMWGIWGAVLAVPMVLCIKVICDHVADLQWVGELLGD
jgi:predicted PurR-regulated permease PerM